MKLETDLIKEAGFTPTRYSKNKDAVIMFMAYDRQDNNKFISNMTKAVKSLHARKVNITPKELSKFTGYPIKEIELNLFEIVQIMNGLGI